MVGDGPGAADTASEEYVGLLLRELGATIMDKSSGAGGSIDPRRVRAVGGLTSIFFGGGTPSLTSPPLVQRVVGALTEAFGLAENAEVRVCLYKAGHAPINYRSLLRVPQQPHGQRTSSEQISMEMDPGTFDLPRLQAFVQECGVTRVSMGVQAFDAGLLAACGRAHRWGGAV